VIVVHRYVSILNGKGKTSGRGGSTAAKLAALGRGLAHVKYIQHRPGLDKEKGGREFFDEEGNRISGVEVRDLVKSMKNARIVLHSLTFSPQINIADKKDLTKEVMDKFADAKGQDFKWVAVEHNNTDHFHVHVVLFGKDKNGKDVFLKKEDYAKLRQFGDDHLERFYPVDLYYENKRKEREKEEIAESLARAKELSKAERIKEGLELPWLHKKIIREQYEPYSEWKKKQKLKEQESANRKAQRKEKRERLDTIEAAGKHWSKDNTLKELNDLNEYLWDNYEDRLGHTEYCKLVAWIKEKERIERGEQEPAAKSKDGKEPDADKDYFKYKGKKYNEKTSYDDFKELASRVHGKGAERLSFDDYQKFRGWMENAERARWHGILEKQIELAKDQHEKREHQKLAPNNGRSPGSIPGGKIPSLFGTIAAVGRVAYELVRIFDFSMGHDTSVDTDRKREETIFQPDMHRQIKGP
jgi:hypothetical protein